MDPHKYRSSQPIQPRTDGWTNAAIIRTVLLIAVIAALLALLWAASDILMLIFLGVLFGLAVSRAADYLARWRIPRALSAATVVLGVVAGLIGIGSYVGPTLVQQTGQIRTQLPAALKGAELWMNAHTNGLASTIISDQTAAAAGDSTATESVQRHPRLDVAQQVSDGLKIATRLVFGFLSSSLAVIAGVGLMFVLAIYVGAEADLYRRGLLSLIPPTSRPRAAEVMAATADTLRKWLVTQLIAMLTIGVATYIALKIIGVQAAFALALIAGLLEFIPTLGPFMSGAIAVAMAFLDSPSRALLTLIAMVVIQELENNLLIPILMKGKLDIPPALTLVAQALMAVIFGFAGLLVAVPFLAAVIVPVRMLYIQDALGGPHVDKRGGKA